MRSYRRALETVVSKEAKAYGFTIVVWSAGALLIADRGKPTAAAVLVFAGGVLAAHVLCALLAFGDPTREWQSPNPREYVWTTFHTIPVAAGVLVAWGLAALITGMWAFFVAPFGAVTAYELLLGVESLVLNADRPVEAASPELSASKSD